MRKTETDAHRLFSSLQAVKLAILSFLLGGGLLTLLDTIFILGTETENPGAKVAVSLLSMFYGILFALLLLPVRYRLESKLEEMNEKCDKI